MLDKADNQIIEFLRNRRSVVAANLTEPGPNEDELNTIIEILFLDQDLKQINVRQQ